MAPRIPAKLDKLTVPELRKLAKRFDIKVTGLRKEDLVEALEPYQFAQKHGVLPNFFGDFSSLKKMVDWYDSPEVPEWLLRDLGKLGGTSRYSLNTGIWLDAFDVKEREQWSAVRISNPGGDNWTAVITYKNGDSVTVRTGQDSDTVWRIYDAGKTTDGVDVEKGQIDTP